MFKIFERSEANPCLTARFSKYSSSFASIQFRHPIHILQLCTYVLHTYCWGLILLKWRLTLHPCNAEKSFTISQSVIFFHRHNWSFALRALNVRLKWNNCPQKWFKQGQYCLTKQPCIDLQSIYLDICSVQSQGKVFARLLNLALNWEFSKTQKWG